MIRELERRIKHHTDCRYECEEKVREVQAHYEIETRRGLDEYQLATLLQWRKEEIAKASALREFHRLEALWLRTFVIEMKEREL